MPKNKLRQRVVQRRTSKRIKKSLKETWENHWIYKVFKFFKGGNSGK